MKKIFPCLVFSFMLISSCSNSETQTNSSENQEESSDSNTDANSSTSTAIKQIEEIGKAMENMVKEQSNGETVKPVNFRALKELLPDKASGIPRTNSSGETSAMMGFSISKAEGTYSDESKDKKGKITIEIIDVAGTQIVMVGLAAWSMVEIDKEDDYGFERTMVYKDGKAHQKYDSKRKRGEFTTIVGNRFIVKVEGRDVEMKEINGVMDDINFNKLKNLKSDD